MYSIQNIQADQIIIPSSWMILFPLYQGGEAARSFFQEVIKYLPLNQCLVVDDGSIDSIPSELISLGLNVVRHKQNLGKSAAIKTGLMESQKQGFTWTLCMDADGQHLLRDIPNFVCVWRKYNNLSMLLGKRDFGQGMPFPRVMSNTITSVLISILAKQRIYDSQNGFRLYKNEDILALNVKSQGFQWESEVILKLVWNQKRLIHADTTTYYGEEVSSIHPMRDIIRFVKMYLRLILKRIKT